MKLTNPVLLASLLLYNPTTVRAGFWDGIIDTKKKEEDVVAGDVKAKLGNVPAMSKASAPAPAKATQPDDGSYGVDISFPMHHAKVSTNYAYLPHNLDPSLPVPKQYRDMKIQPLGNRQKAYDDFMASCRAFYPKQARRCDMTESDRVEMSLRQPQSMQNYTEIGFKKLKAPEKLFGLLKDFWDKNQDKAKQEQWGVANTYTNNWEVPSFMVSVEDSGLRGGGYSLKQKIWDSARETIGEWTGEELTQCSLYGIRVYKAGSILAPHVDRLPLVSSAIINVAQDVDEPWPLEVIGHDGKAYNVTMEPGEMILYESHSVIHGRPYPMKGRFMANIFVHFEPTGHSLRHDAGIDADGKDVHQKYREALAKGVSGHENDNTGLPPYIKAGSPEAAHWRQTHPTGLEELKKVATFTTGSTDAHEAAKHGKVDELHEHIKKSKDVVHAKDENGWTPLHEGVRGGHAEVVKLLIQNGADVNEMTKNGESALWWAKQMHGEDHPVVQLLEELGALMMGPEL